MSKDDTHLRRTQRADMMGLGTVLGELLGDLTEHRLKAATDVDLLGPPNLISRWRLVNTSEWVGAAEALEREWELIADAEQKLQEPGLTDNAFIAISNAIATHRNRAALHEEHAKRYAEYAALLASEPHERGCWCLGLGGRGSLKPIVQEWVWSEWCVCKRARELQAIWKSACEAADLEWEQLQQAEAQAAAQARRRVLYQRANLPFHFRDCTLDTMPLTENDGTPVEGRASMLERFRQYGLPSPLRDPVDPRRKLNEDAPEPLRTWLYLHGTPSRGKTGIAQAVLRLWLDADREGHFVHMSDLLARIRATYQRKYSDSETTDEVIMFYSTVYMLVIDDLGTEKMTEWVREQLDTILNNRKLANRPTVMTSNYTLHEQTARLSTEENPKGGERIVERIMQMCDAGRNVWEITGPNLRWSGDANQTR